MKRVFVLLLTLSLLTSLAFALEGLTVGAGVLFDDLGADDIEPSIQVQASWEGDITEDLFLFSELTFTQPTADDADGMLDIILELTYNLNDCFNLYLQNWTFIPFADGADVYSWIVPGAMFTQSFGCGSLFYRLDLPLLVMSDGDPFDTIGLDFTFSALRLRDKGWGNGFGFQVALYCILSDSDFLQTATITPYIETDLYYAELEIGIPLYEDGFKNSGLFITPEIEFNLPPVDGLSIWLNAPISNIGADDGDVVFGLGLGLKYYF
jgi:hypothetical protein